MSSLAIFPEVTSLFDERIGWQANAKWNIAENCTFALCLGGPKRQVYDFHYHFGRYTLQSLYSSKKSFWKLICKNLAVLPSTPMDISLAAISFDFGGGLAVGCVKDAMRAEAAISSSPHYPFLFCCQALPRPISVKSSPHSKTLLEEVHFGVTPAALAVKMSHSTSNDQVKVTWFGTLVAPSANGGGVRIENAIVQRSRLPLSWKWPWNALRVTTGTRFTGTSVNSWVTELKLDSGWQVRVGRRVNSKHHHVLLGKDIDNDKFVGLSCAAIDNSRISYGLVFQSP